MKAKGDATTSTNVQESTIFTTNVQLSTIIVTVFLIVTIIVDNCTLVVKMVDSCTIVLVVASPLVKALYTFRGGNWIRLCILLGVETKSSFVHF